MTSTDALVGVRPYAPPTASPDPNRRYAVRVDDRRLTIAGAAAFRLATWAHGLTLGVVLVTLPVTGLASPAGAVALTLAAALIGLPTALIGGTLVAWGLGRVLRRVPWMLVHLLAFATAGAATASLGLLLQVLMGGRVPLDLWPYAAVAAGAGAAGARAIHERRRPTRLR